MLYSESPGVDISNVDKNFNTLLAIKLFWRKAFLVDLETKINKNKSKIRLLQFKCGMCGSLIVCPLDSGSIGLGSSLGRGHNVAFFGQDTFERPECLI